jgi:hypothetical protein
MLIFGKANAKLRSLEVKMKDFLGKRRLVTVSTLAGWGCPYANICESRVHSTPEGLRVVDGPANTVRCFSASQEALYTNVYHARKHNLELIRQQGNKLPALVALFLGSIPKNAGIIRLHVSGDFMTQAHYDGWLRVAEQRPDLLIYGYTKSLPFYVKRKDAHPDNFRITPSLGGKRDDLIHRFGLHYARIVESQDEADYLGLETDHDDSHALCEGLYGKTFALVEHGPQKGRRAKGGYSRKKVGAS